MLCILAYHLKYYDKETLASSAWYANLGSSQSPPLPGSLSSCDGSRSPDELADILWGSSSNYTEYKQTRPNLSKLVSENPMANPSRAEADIIKVALEILSVKALNQKRNEIELILRVDQFWNDYRLQYEIDDGCYADYYYESFPAHSNPPDIWQPASMIKNLVASITELKGSYRIYPNGNVQFIRENKVTLSCGFDLKTFPNDEQVCSIIMGAWKSQKKDVLYQFANPAVINPESHGGLADTDEWTLITTEATANDSGENDITFSMKMKRKSEYYDDFVKLPVILMVVLGWSSFFIDRSAVPARITMTTFGFLTIMNFLNSQLATLPRIGPSQSWLLQFMLVSLIFCFYTVVEYVFVNYLYRVERRTDKIQEKAAQQKKKTDRYRNG